MCYGFLTQYVLGTHAHNHGLAPLASHRSRHCITPELAHARCEGRRPRPPFLRSSRDAAYAWPAVPTDDAHPPAVYVGCAGWSLPRDAQPHFPAAGTHLARYAARLPATEINASFYRPPRPATYARWAASVPPAFRFSVKLPRAITHEHRLADAGALLDAFLAGAVDDHPSSRG